MPALLNAMSSRPKVAMVLFRAAVTSAAFVTSQRTASARPPCCSIMRAVSRLPFSETSAATTLTPSRANASAAARPMPLAAPVTKATLPAKLPFEFVVIVCSCSHVLLAVLFVGDLLHPRDRRAVQALLNGDMRHRRRGRRPVPVTRAGRDLNHVAGPDLLHRPAFLLDPAETAGDDQGLAERVRMPHGAGTGLERDAPPT